MLAVTAGFILAIITVGVAVMAGDSVELRYRVKGLTSRLVRVGVLVLLAGIAPLALACYSLPWTQAAAGLWWRSLLGYLGTEDTPRAAVPTGTNMIHIRRVDAWCSGPSRAGRDCRWQALNAGRYGVPA